MAAVRNVARDKLEQGQLALGVGIRMSRSVEIAKAMAVAGFDWLFLDMEHGVMSLEGDEAIERGDDFGHSAVVCGDDLRADPRDRAATRARSSRTRMGQVEGKVAIVTGGASGIG